MAENAPGKTRAPVASLTVAVLGFAVFVGTGCGTLKSFSSVRPSPDTWNVKTSGGTSVNQKGGAETPAKVSESKAVSVLPVPVGSTVSLPSPDKPGASPVVTLAAASELRVESSATIAESPRSFAPPAPPSPSAVASGAGVRLFYWLAAAFAVCAVVCFYMGHAKAGVVCALSAGGLPLLASVSVWAAEHAAVAAGCVAGALVVAWYLLRNRLSTTEDKVT